jgi:hypothetical protein
MQLLTQNILGNECNKKLASPNIDLTLGVIGALAEGNLICLFVMMFSNTLIFKHYVRNVFCFKYRNLLLCLETTLNM